MPTLLPTKLLVEGAIENPLRVNGIPRSAWAQEMIPQVLQMATAATANMIQAISRSPIDLTICFIFLSQRKCYC